MRSMLCGNNDTEYIDEEIQIILHNRIIQRSLDLLNLIAIQGECRFQ